MALLEKRKREIPEIPTASMADIAFLLLIFFLVTTTIDVDTGIGMVLPPKLDQEVEPPPVRERNMLKILVKAQGMVLIEEQPSAINQIRDKVRQHVLNYGEDPAFSEDPDKAIVSIKVDRQTPYDTYIQTLDEVWMGYFEIWDQEARQLGYTDYATYRDVIEENNAENEIREKIKANISIAEPDVGEGT